jgi:sulfoxide reductase heme-binding subunit YedZ
VDIRWWQMFSPVGSSYRPLWLGLGSLSFDVMLVVALSSAVRMRLTPKVWRAVHLTSYVTWPVALAHSYGIGTDAGDLWARWLSVGCVAGIVVAGTARLSSERQFRREMQSAGVVS